MSCRKLFRKIRGWQVGLQPAWGRSGCPASSSPSQQNSRWSCGVKNQRNKKQDIGAISMKSRPWCSGVRNRQVFPLALPLAYGNSERRGCRLASRPLFFTGFPSVSHLFPARENNAALGRDQSQTSARAEQPSNGKQTILGWDQRESVLRCTICEFIFFPRYVARQLPSRLRTDPPATPPRPFQPHYGTPFSLDTNGEQRAGARSSIAGFAANS